MKGESRLYALAIAAGLVAWFGIALATGRREAWDSRAYWILAVPAMYVLAAVLASLAPRKPWRWAVLPFLAQFAAMVVTTGGGNLWPIGLVMMLLLSVPGVVAAAIVARRRRRADAEAEAPSAD